MLLERWSHGATAVGCAATGARRRVAAAASVPWEADSVECGGAEGSPRAFCPSEGVGMYVYTVAYSCLCRGAVKQSAQPVRESCAPASKKIPLEPPKKTGK